MQLVYESDSLMHFGVPGMRWGHRKQRPVGNGRLVQRTSPNKSAKKAVRNQAKRKKILTDSQKQTLKAVGKTALKVACGVAATAALGTVGSMAFSHISNQLSNNYYFDSSGAKQFYNPLHETTKLTSMGQTTTKNWRYRPDGTRVLIGKTRTR